MTVLAECTTAPSMNRISPARTRAMVRARLIRRIHRGRAFLAQDRIAVIGDVGELVAQLVKRRQAIAESSDEIEARAGVTENHLAKIEAGSRVPGLDLFCLLVRAMGGEVRIVWKDEP